MRALIWTGCSVFSCFAMASSDNEFTSEYFEVTDTSPKALTLLTPEEEHMSAFLSDPSQWACARAIYLIDKCKSALPDTDFIKVQGYMDYFRSRQVGGSLLPPHPVALEEVAQAKCETLCQLKPPKLLPDLTRDEFFYCMTRFVARSQEKRCEVIARRLPSTSNVPIYSITFK